MAHVNFLMATAVCRNGPEELHAARKITFFFSMAEKERSTISTVCSCCCCCFWCRHFHVLKAVAIASFSVDATAHPWDVSQTALSLYSPAKIWRKIILTPYIPSKYRTTDLCWGETSVELKTGKRALIQYQRMSSQISLAKKLLFYSEE